MTTKLNSFARTVLNFAATSSLASCHEAAGPSDERGRERSPSEHSSSAHQNWTKIGFNIDRSDVFVSIEEPSSENFPWADVSFYIITEAKNRSVDFWEKTMGYLGNRSLGHIADLGGNALG